MKKGFTLIELVVVVALVLIGYFIIFTLSSSDFRKVEGDINCEHEFVVSSKYILLRGQYETISKCIKCGKEV